MVVKGERMISVIMDNEIHIARKEKLLGYEKEVLEMLLAKKHDASQLKISEKLRIRPEYVDDIVNSLREKLGYNWTIKTSKSGSWIYYSIKEKKEN